MLDLTQYQVKPHPLKAKIDSYGLLRIVVARATGMSQSYLCSYLTGTRERNPKADAKLQAFVDAMETTHQK